MSSTENPDTKQTGAAPRPSARNAWLLLAASFITFSVSAACMQSYTVFLVAFIEEFGWSRGEASIAYSVSQMINGMTSPLVGVLVDRLGPARLVLIGGVVLALGLFASSFVDALWQLVLLFGVLMTLGANCLGLVVFVPLLSRRFVRNRGMAVAIVQSANGFARAFSAPLAQVLIAGLGSFLVALHQLAFAVTVGFDKLYAAWVLGLGAFLSLPGVIVTGWLSDRIGRELAGVITYGTSIFGVVCAMFITSPEQHLLLWLHACFFGLTWGARGPSITAKTADLFPGPQLGTILGAITMGTGVGSALGSWLAGFTFDVTGSYRVAFALSIFFYACGSVAFWMLRRPAAGADT